ncbi:MAG: type II toxin-antitoxin system VapC family toxin [bacterium]
MRLLLDTHALIWWLDDNPILSQPAREAISEYRNLVLASVVSVWEIVIKKSLGKLRAPQNLEEELVKHRFQPLPIAMHHALAVEQLPHYHQDPFDRMLVAQAQVESLTLVTRDPMMRKYDVSVLLA